MNGNSENFQKIKLQRMPELVQEQLMDWIMDGTISMGEKLIAEEIAVRLGVSRMPVREALKNMEKSGIVNSIPFVGARVAELQMTDIVQIYLMREALEPIAAYYACKNMTEEKLDRINAVQKRLENVFIESTPNAKQIFVLNREFHFEIYSVSGMKYLINTISSLWDNLAFYKLIYGRRYVTDKNIASSMLEEHWGYIQRLREKQASDLKTIMHDSLHRRVLELKDQVTYEI